MEKQTLNEPSPELRKQIEEERLRGMGGYIDHGEMTTVEMVDNFGDTMTDDQRDYLLSLGGYNGTVEHKPVSELINDDSLGLTDTDKQHLLALANHHTGIPIFPGTFDEVGDAARSGYKGCNTFHRFRDEA